MSYAEKFIETLDKEELKHSKIERTNDNEADYVRFGMKGNNTDVGVVAFFPDGSNRVAVRCFDVAEHIPDDRCADVLICCNKLNGDYNFVKFVLDDDGAVSMRADAYIDETTGGEETFRLCMTMIQIADEAYPELMKALWS